MEGKRDSFFLSNKKENKKPGKEDKNRDKKSNKEDSKKKRFNNFNKNRVGVQNDQKPEENSEKMDKKPFDKKAYRLKKYSKKYKLEQWEEQRKKRLMRDYEKTMKNDAMAGSYKPISFDEDATDSHVVGRFVRHPDLLEDEVVPKSKDPLNRAKEQYNKVKQDKLQKQKEIKEAKEERQKKIEEYKKKKQERFKKLSKKTKKGQPVMTGRLELLLEKIQQG